MERPQFIAPIVLRRNETLETEQNNTGLTYSRYWYYNLENYAKFHISNQDYTTFSPTLLEHFTNHVVLHCSPDLKACLPEELTEPKGLFPWLLTIRGKWPALHTCTLTWFHRWRPLNQHYGLSKTVFQDGQERHLLQHTATCLKSVFKYETQTDPGQRGNRVPRQGASRILKSYPRKRLHICRRGDHMRPWGCSWEQDFNE